MKRKLLSTLLALAMALTLLPTAALGADPAEPTVHQESWITNVNFYYRGAAVVPEKSDAWADHSALRNVFAVKLSDGYTTEDKKAGVYSFAVKAGAPGGDPKDAGYHEVPAENVYYDQEWPTPNLSKTAYFEVPDGVLTSGQSTYTVRVVKTDGTYDEASITLKKVTFKDNAGGDISDKSAWIEADQDHVLQENGGFCAFVSAQDSYPDLPSLADKGDGQGQFLGWATTQGQENSQLIASIPNDTTLYAVFGERPNRVLKVRTQDSPEGQEVAWGVSATHTVEFGQRGALTLYIRNEGNRAYKNVYTSSTAHFDMTYVTPTDPGVTKVTEGVLRDCYNIEPGKTLAVRFTPKENIPVGSYDDQTTLHNETDSTIRYIPIHLEVTPRQVELTADNITKTYGQNLTSDAVNWSVDGDEGDTLKSLLSGGLTFTSQGFFPATDVKEDGYPIEIQNSQGNFKVSWKGDGPKVVVNPATP